MKEDRGNRTLKDSSGISAKIEGPIEASPNDSAKHNRERELAVNRKQRTIERLESEGVLKMDVIVDTAKSAFHRTIQQSLVPKHKPKELSSDSITPIGVGRYENEAQLTDTAKDMNAELDHSSTRLREIRFSYVNPPMSEDEDRIESRASDSARSRRIEHLDEKLNNQTSGTRPSRLFKKKSKEPKNSTTTKHAKKERKRPGSFRLFCACFGGDFCRDDEHTESVINNEQPDPFVLPSRRSPDTRDYATHRYSRRQAFIRTMMESHLENHRN